MRLCEALKKHISDGYYPAHMPGHKGDPRYSFLGDILKYDITEIDGLDDLHNADGVILESEKFAAGLYGVKETHFLINGSTVGVLCAILGVTKPGDKILVARNCHRSVYNAIEVNRLDVRYVYPEMAEDIGIFKGITSEPVEESLKKDPQIKAVIITSPTYEGISSDIAGIAETVHRYGAVLIVDAAHGAHFGFNEDFPEAAGIQGADIVINSVHKTLPAPTQTALLHINDIHGVKVDSKEIKRQLSIYQSTSPSYLLMAGIDNCLSIVSEHGEELFEQYLYNLKRFEDRASKLKNIKVIGRKLLKDQYGIENGDPCKLLICSSGLNKSYCMSGRELYDILRREYHIQPEMAADRYCLLIMTIMDTREGFDRLINALECIDEKFSDGYTPFMTGTDDERAGVFGSENNVYGGINGILYGSRPVRRMSAYEAVDRPSYYVRLEEAAGRISASYIYLYPPGIPVLVPGEEISEEMAAAIGCSTDRGLNVLGLKDNKEIRVHG